MRRRTSIVLFILGISMAILGGLLPKSVFADPHAMFFTDRGQEQLFYNVLASLNQADFVEPPKQPYLTSDARLGLFIQTGTYLPSNMNREVTRDASGNPVSVSPPLEPQETQGVDLPRIRVRQVTSDDGDVFFRERMERRALAEEMRVLFAQLACRTGETIFGRDTIEADKYCRIKPDEAPLPGL